MVMWFFSSDGKTFEKAPTGKSGRTERRSVMDRLCGEHVKRSQSRWRGRIGPLTRALVWFGRWNRQEIQIVWVWTCKHAAAGQRRMMLGRG